ncbi:MAG: hypothetical protein RLZZ181_660 [Pseudomonadota bacterium]|jgi:hypothetical protein
MMYDQVVITNASREGARAGVVGVVQGFGYASYPTCSSSLVSITDGIPTASCTAGRYMNNLLFSFYSPTPSPTITSTNIGTCSPLPPGNLCKISVNITYAFRGPVSSFISSILGSSRTLTATTVMYYE